MWQNITHTKNSLCQTKNCFKLDRSVHAWNRVLHKKIIVIQRVKWPAFYGTQRFSVMFTRTWCLTLSWARWIQSNILTPYSYNIHFNITQSMPRSFKWFHLHKTKHSSSILCFSLYTFLLLSLSCEPGSSVNIVSGYGPDDRAIEVQSWQRKKDFSSSVCVQTRSGTHPASYTMGTRGPFPGAKARPRHDTDHLSPL
jgi:hypothetical protein